MSEIYGNKLLVVGAGGIGCELLKTLVVTGFNNIHIIDFDTIEVSNLNRQFLFNKSHVGMSKAKISRESVLKINSKASIVAYSNDITSPEFDLDYFKSFTVVLNALDNRTARSHVNKMCILANIPMIDGGTSGFLGQLHSITACYDCEPKIDNKKKTYPVCTIRNTPSEIIHCVVWSKYLFELLFSVVNKNETFEKSNLQDIEDDEEFISNKIKLVINTDDSIDKFIKLIIYKV